MSKNSTRGLIFDIQRFSIHDGDGIRTNVFFKGCSLNCAWCHNPEGISPERRLVYSKNKCINCGTCTKVSSGAILISEDKNIKIDYSMIKDLDKIENACPTNALSVDSHYWSVEDLVKEVMKDQIFFRDDGGVTVSGGECLIQSDFISSFFKQLKKEEVNTAIETALNIPIDNLKQVLPYTDQIYFDIKTLDEKVHEKYIGSNLKRIIENAEYILKSDHREKVIVRTPLIPNITATKENISAISKFISENYKEVKYELLNYNALTESKYDKVGKKYSLEDLKPLSDEDLKLLIDVAKNSGVKNIINKI